MSEALSGRGRERASALLARKANNLLVLNHHGRVRASVSGLLLDKQRSAVQCNEIHYSLPQNLQLSVIPFFRVASVFVLAGSVILGSAVIAKSQLNVRAPNMKD